MPILSALRHESAFYTHLHNKGVVIDLKRVIVSSTNWSENSIARAREAGVLIECPEVASYFAEVFDFDWSIGVPISELPPNIIWLPQATRYYREKEQFLFIQRT